MSERIRIGVIFGGKSAEHEVSLQSAKNIIEALDREKYEPVLIGIDKQGHWLVNNESKFLLNEEDPKLIQLNVSSDAVALVPGQESEQLLNVSRQSSLGHIDVAFPVLHGPYGEDGSVQGLLKLANIPFVGAGVLGSAVGMDKDVMKRLLRDAGLLIAKFFAFYSPTSAIADFSLIKQELGLPLFVKPANLGSSVGISKARNLNEYEQAVKVAFQYDTKIIVEEYIKGREIECSVLGNGEPKASVPGEILPSKDFYSYEAKYIDENGAGLEIPANLPKDVIRRVQEQAIKAFKVLCCEGMARVDFFLTDDNKVVVNELNTIPGFTRISMYPKLWEASGLSYSELIDKLVGLALERHQLEQKLKTYVDI